MDRWMGEEGIKKGRRNEKRIDEWMNTSCIMLIVGRHVSYAFRSEIPNISLLFALKSFPSIPQGFPRIFDA